MMRSNNVALVTLPALHDKNLLRSNYRTARSGRCHSRNQEYKSVHGRRAAALLVLLPGAARTRVVPPDLGSIAPWLARVGTRVDLSMRPEIAIRTQQSSRHVHDEQQPSRRCWSGESIFAFAPWGVTEAGCLGRGGTEHVVGKG